MPMNQEEKIKNILWGKGYNIDKASEKLEISRQTFYNRIRKTPLDKDFILLVKEKLGIDLQLDTQSLQNEIKKPDQIDQAEIDSLNAEVKRLKDELLRLQAELIEFYKKK